MGVDISRMRKHAKVLQFIKYCCVGLLNTAITLGVIYTCKSLFGCNLYVSNAIGYLCGLANSFFCNKHWVFHSHGRYTAEAAKFVTGFFVCYLLQLWTVWMMTDSAFGKQEFDILGIVLSGYGIATLTGNIVYTLANFAFSRLVTFRNQKR